MTWITEVEELHAFFGSWFRGETSDLGRLQAALGPHFTIVSPDGTVRGRPAILEAIKTAHAADPTLRITTTDHQEISVGSGWVAGTYIERHVRSTGETARIATAILEPSDAAPHGLSWHHVHETWLERPA